MRYLQLLLLLCDLFLLLFHFLLIGLGLLNGLAQLLGLAMVRRGNDILCSSSEVLQHALVGAPR